MQPEYVLLKQENSAKDRAGVYLSCCHFSCEYLGRTRGENGASRSHGMRRQGGVC